MPAFLFSLRHDCSARGRQGPQSPSEKFEGPSWLFLGFHRLNGLEREVGLATRTLSISRAGWHRQNEERALGGPLISSSFCFFAKKSATNVLVGLLIRWSSVQVAHGPPHSKPSFRDVFLGRQERRESLGQRHGPALRPKVRRKETAPPIPHCRISWMSALAASVLLKQGVANRVLGLSSQLL